MQRRKFSREFKVEAVRLVRDRDVSAAQPARDLEVHENELRKWVKEFAAAPAGALSGHGQAKRAFRAQDQPREIVTGRSLAGAQRATHQLATRQDDLRERTLSFIVPQRTALAPDAPVEAIPPSDASAPRPGRRPQWPDAGLLKTKNANFERR